MGMTSNAKQVPNHLLVRADLELAVPQEDRGVRRRRPHGAGLVPAFEVFDLGPARDPSRFFLDRGQAMRWIEDRLGRRRLS